MIGLIHNLLFAGHVAVATSIGARRLLARETIYAMKLVRG